MTWTREHDALIARVAEGLKVIESEYEADWTTWRPGQAVRWKLAYYLYDLSAIARAQEAWRKQDPENRSYQFWSIGPELIAKKASCTMIDAMKGHDCIEPLPEAAARAWATWRSCGGVEWA